MSIETSGIFVEKGKCLEKFAGNSYNYAFKFLVHLLVMESVDLNR